MSEPWYDMRLAPARGDGCLTENDVEAVICRVPQGSRVRVIVSDCEWYESGVPGVLARWLFGADVQHHFDVSAWKVARLWVAAYDAAAADYAVSEINRLGSA